MKVWKKLSAVALALVMVMALCVPAFAEGDTPTPAELASGELGGYSTADTPIKTIDKAVNIKKEITAYNPDETIIYGPEITYTYTVVPATGTTELTSITDATTDHVSGVAVVATPLSGVTTGVKVNDGAAGDTSSATGTLDWTNADILKANTVDNHGAANIKDVKIDFSAVVFEKPGVYRYKITESVDSSTKNYTTAGVTDDSSNVRYLDVYVMRSDAYVELDSTKTAYVADDWTIYGYVCVEPANLTIVAEAGATAGTTKTNGFVNSAGSDANSNADQYHTYNLTVSKVLEKDTTAMQNHQFPFTVTFSHATASGNFQLIAEKSTKVSGTTTTETKTTALDGTTSVSNLLKIGGSAPLSNFNVSDIAIAHDNNIKFIGLPNGTTFVVTETNNVDGTTYSTSATEAVGTGVAAGVVLTTSGGTLSVDNKTASIGKTNTATYTRSSAATDDSNIEIVFTNVLALISPTGVTLRYAPYMAMMGLGVVALPLSLRKKEELD